MFFLKGIFLTSLAFIIPSVSMAAAQEKGKITSSPLPSEMHKQVDNTDIFAIPLDNSEKEEESQVKDLEKNMEQPQKKSSIKF